MPNQFVSQAVDPLDLASAKLDALAQKLTQLETQYGALAQAAGQLPDLRLMQASDDIAPIKQLIASSRQAIVSRPPSGPVLQVNPAAQAGMQTGATVGQQQQLPNGTYVSLPAALGIGVVGLLAGGVGGWYARSMKKYGSAHEGETEEETKEE